MPLVFEQLCDLKEYIESYPTAPIFYRREDLNFTIMAGKASWEGSVRDKKEADDLEAWLKDRGAVKVKGWKDIVELFGGR